ncbi:PulJ/GspJ family protein [Bradyrhizobium arachidis]|uniref:General secretion pathway protein GspJ n=1 Tax=Bradyrhizobium arachidis TaxID=858423 RepID=A0AAE7TJG0_9BRAD|nr:prepilin-type N-terminal cleavage/methylation domain-containing protein [Bradyrhizobium arachidis]QOZ69941.1 general secretion pathway protein GspJ [Bradyrhizobium arachidis]SFV12330.1 type II secretion system protein J (GspJ) [Bradyrhizobium arachidis]
MSPSLVRMWRSNAGFTMFEALVALALMGLVLGVLASVTGGWLPPWNRGLLQTQRNEQVTIALDRLAADLSAAEFVTPNRDSTAALFRGDESSIVFVRSALGPNNRPGLEIVRIAETADRTGRALVRAQAPFVLLPSGDPAVDPIPFRDPVVLLRAPLRITFAYAGPRGDWFANWPAWAGLPTTVRFDLHDAEGAIVLSTATRVRANTAAPQSEPVSDARPGDSQAANNNAIGVR